VAEDRTPDPVAVSVAAYDAHADGYESAYAARYADIVARFAASLPVPSRILDAGCGPGRDLARFVAHGHLPVGLDLSAPFVAKARRHAPTMLGDLRDVAALRPGARFDGIWAAASLVHLPETDARDVLGQFAALLRPGGKLFLSVRCAGETGWLDEPDGRRWYAVWPPDALDRAVTDAGFIVDDVSATTYVELWATRAPDAPAETVEAGDGGRRA